MDPRGEEQLQSPLLYQRYSRWSIITFPGLASANSPEIISAHGCLTFTGQKRGWKLTRRSHLCITYIPYSSG